MTRGFRRTAAALVAAGAVAFAAGCGGDDESSALSADELRTQADAICADVNTANDAIAAPEDAAGVLPFLQATRDANQSGLDRLKELTPPEELADLWGQAIALNETQLELINGAITRIEGGEDPEAVINEVGPQAEANSEQLDGLAQQLGLTVCGADDEDEPTETTPTDTEPTETLPPVETETEPAETEPAETEPADPSSDVGTIEQYLADAQAAAGALSEFGSTLQSLASPEELASRTDEITETLDEFDAAIARMDGYTMEEAQLERQRSQLVAQGPTVSDTLRRFVDAAAAEDQAAVQALLPEVLQALQDFSTAATDVG